MEKNVGKADAIIRVIIAVTIFYFMESWGPGMQAILGVIAVVLILTALTRVCLLYRLFHTNTAKKKPKNTY